MDNKWTFYRLGISNKTNNENEIGGMLDFHSVRVHKAVTHELCMQIYKTIFV